MERREGIVYVEAEVSIAADAPVSGHWEPDPGHPEAELDAPDGWMSEEAAIAWGRHRAPVVTLRRHRLVHAWRYRHVGGHWVRLRAPDEGEYQFFSAGEVDTGPGDEDEPVTRWPGAPLQRDSETHPRYGGVVFLASELEAGRPGSDVRYSAAWEVVRDDELVTWERFGPATAEEAITWARERAAIVLVCDLPIENAYWTAGDLDIPELELPRWGEIDPATRRGSPGGGWTASHRAGRRFPIGRPDPGTDGWLF